MRRKGILSQKRPAAGGEARGRASFLWLRKDLYAAERNFVAEAPPAGGEARGRASFFLEPVTKIVKKI